MDESTLLLSQLQHNEAMIINLAKNVNDELLDYKPTPRAMSIRQHFVHLTECHLACEEYMRGDDHKWGSYIAQNSDFKAIYEEYLTTRNLAIRLLLSSESHKALAMLSDLVALHEPYHIGQMSLNRQGFDSSWDSESIYCGLE